MNATLFCSSNTQTSPVGAFVVVHVIERAMPKKEGIVVTTGTNNK
jgi:hypothetical protein